MNGGTANERKSFKETCFETTFEAFDMDLKQTDFLSIFVLKQTTRDGVYYLFCVKR